MSWTQEPPKEDGWYWMRRDFFGPATVAYCTAPFRSFDGRCQPFTHNFAYKSAIKHGWQWWSIRIEHPPT